MLDGINNVVSLSNDINLCCDPNKHCKTSLWNPCISGSPNSPKQHSSKWLSTAHLLNTCILKIRLLYSHIPHTHLAYGKCSKAD